MDDEIVDLNFGDYGDLLPPKENGVALIDADTLIFASCVATEVREELLPRSFYTDLEWMEIESDPYFDEDAWTLSSIDMDVAFMNAKSKLRTLLDKSGCEDYELHFTSGRKSFRYTMVTADYKANRREYIPPIGLSQLKVRFVMDTPNKCFIHTCYEADDTVVARKTALPDKYMICAVDKDVLYSLPGKHFNYYTSAKYDIDMKFVEVTEEQARKHHFMQVLTGDTGDNVIGLHMIGPKKAATILEGCDTDEQCWDAISEAYLKKGRDPIDAIINMRLVSMNQVRYLPETDEYKLRLYGKDTDEEC